jgi:streptomycin 6-kinase
VLLHGDLHLGNVLDGGPSRGLVAIDPKACLGDPCFDAVDYVVVIASMVAVAHLTYDGPEPAIDELLALAR